MRVNLTSIEAFTLRGLLDGACEDITDPILGAGFLGGLKAVCENGDWGSKRLDTAALRAKLLHPGVAYKTSADESAKDARTAEMASVFMGARVIVTKATRRRTAP